MIKTIEKLIVILTLTFYSIVFVMFPVISPKSAVSMFPQMMALHIIFVVFLFTLIAFAVLLLFIFLQRFIKWQLDYYSIYYPIIEKILIGPLGLTSVIILAYKFILTLYSTYMLDWYSIYFTYNSYISRNYVECKDHIVTFKINEIYFGLCNVFIAIGTIYCKLLYFIITNFIVPWTWIKTYIDYYQMIKKIS